MESALYTVIADIVGSRRQPDRTALQEHLLVALQEVAAAVPAVQPLAPTVGDEVQGAFTTLPDAVTAALRLRLTMHPVELRCGLGHGQLTVFDAARTPVSQDGPAWWTARAAIEEVKLRAVRPRERTLRTWFQSGNPASVAAVNAYLTCRDEVLASMSARAMRLLLGVVRGRQQQELAAQEGISQSAVSQALSRSGAWSVLASLDALRDAA